MDSSSEGGSDRCEEKGIFEYFGWVYHLGVNSVGREYCHLRFLFIRGKCVAMYKRDPHENPDINPIRQGVVGATLMVEEIGCRKVNNTDLYVIRFYNRLNETRKGENSTKRKGSLIFCMDLTKDLDEVRGRILETKPLPAIREVFVAVRREECRRKMMMNVTPTMEETQQLG